MWTCVKWEYRRQWRQGRYWTSLSALAVLGVVFAYGYQQMSNQSGLGDIFGRGLSDGFFVPVVALTISSSILLPFCVVLISAETIASERHLGTWSLMLTQGISPWRIYTGKWIVSISYAAAATFVLMATSLGSGIVAFGWHRTVLPSGTVASTPELGQLLFVMCCYTAIGQMAVASVALAVGSFCRHSVTAVMITMGSLILMVLMGDFPILADGQKLLLASYFSRFADALSFPINWTGMLHGVWVFFIYGMLSWGLVAWLEPFRD